MNYVLQNDYLSVQVTSLGAELQSIKSTKTNTEYLWQGNPEFWGGRATVIFPFCGRLFEEKYTHQGKVYQMGLHGLLRKREYELKEQTEDKISFVYKSNEETKENNKEKEPKEKGLSLMDRLKGRLARIMEDEEDEDEEEDDFR